MHRRGSPIPTRGGALLKFYLYSRARISTGCRLRVSEFHQDGEESTIRLHEKGDHRRTIGLHYAAAQAIREYLEKAREAKALLVAGSNAWRAGADPHFTVGPPGVRGVSAAHSAGQFGREDPVEGPRYEEGLEELERLHLAKARNKYAHCLTTAGIELADVIQSARRALRDDPVFHF